MSIFKKISLRTKIICINLGITCVLATSAFFNMNQFASSTKEETSKTIESDAMALGQRVAAQFYERYGDVQAFAANQAIRSFNLEKMQESLDYYTDSYGIYDLILVIDKNGHLVDVNSKDVAGKPVDWKTLKQFNFHDTTWFQAAISGKFTEDKTKGFTGTYFEEFMIDPLMKAAFGEDRLGSSFTTVIKNDKGEVTGVITNRAGKRWMENELIETYALLQHRGLVRPEVTVTNKDGIILSYISGDEKTGKMEIITDTEKMILKENFAKRHVPAGEAALDGKTGAMLSKYDTDPDEDLVGFHTIDNKKWINSIGWKTFVHDSQEDSFQSEVRAARNFYVFTGAVLCFAVIVSVWFGVTISKSISHVTSTLSHSSEAVSSAAEKIAIAATQLSETTTQQAAALQETVAAVDEISAMVDKSSENANRSRDVSAESKSTAERGQATVQQMVEAIEQIDQSNEEVSIQMAESNRQLGDITKLIADIGNKTKVINEIVFQTKLLSFNASVEAARAGEYGKGFSVVAEEVGNLAQMSGNAAKEISTLLDQSVSRVEAIVVETRTKVDRLMATSKDKVKYGSQVAKECNQNLSEILINIEKVDGMVSEIAVSSAEQATGIKEISKAVGQLESATQQSSSVAQSSSVSSEQLKVQSSDLNEVVKTLWTVVQGSGGQAEPATAADFAKNKQNEKKSKPKPASQKILKFTKVKKEESTFSHESTDHTPMKKASGGEDFPSSEDPGFNS